MPWSKKQFFAIEFHTKSSEKRKEYAKEQGMSDESASKLAQEVKPNE
jgi:hypothetical protein